MRFWSFYKAALRDNLCVTLYIVGQIDTENKPHPESLQRFSGHLLAGMIQFTDDDWRQMCRLNQLAEAPRCL